jgi:hypothetical protein
MNIRKPVASYYIGDVTTKNEPQKYILVFQQLFQLYANLRDRYSSTGIIPTSSSFDSNSNNSSSSGSSSSNNNDSKRVSNPFSVLSNDKGYPLPLIVNTDGNIR